MTTHAFATESLHQSRIKPRLFHPSTLLALAAAALVTLGVWNAGNQKHAVPDYIGEVGGLAFSPYHRGETPEAHQIPSEAEIRADLQIASNMTSRIRTYTVAGGMADIPALAADTPLKVTLGAWLDRKTGADDTEIARLIETANANQDVDRVMVGNEVLLRDDLSVNQLIGYIRQVKAGVHVPVSTAEPWHVWMKHPELAASVDYITIHLLPYWEGLPIDDSLRYIMDRLDQVKRAYPNKHVVIGEVGWPSNGVAIGGARASRVNQAIFLRKFFQIAQQRGLDYFVMEAFDQPWKTSFEGRAAGYWGMLDLDRHAKWSMTGSVVETPNWPLWAGCSIAGAALLASLLLSRRPDIRLPGKLLVAGLAQAFGAVFAMVLLAMAGKYLSHFAEIVWGSLAAGQALLLFLLMADSFELAETIFGCVRRRQPLIATAPAGASLPKVSIHLPICNEPPHMVRQTLDALSRLDYPDFEVLVVDNNTTDPALWEPVAEHCARPRRPLPLLPPRSLAGLQGRRAELRAERDRAGRRDRRCARQRLRGRCRLATLHGAAIRQPARGLRAVPAGLPRQRRQLLQAADVLGIRRLLPARHGHPQRAQRHHPARHHVAHPPPPPCAMQAIGASGPSPRTPNSAYACSAPAGRRSTPRAASAAASCRTTSPPSASSVSAGRTVRCRSSAATPAPCSTRSTAS